MANPVFLSIIGKKNEKRALKREVVFDFQRKRLLKLRKRLLPSSGLTCSTLAYAKGLDVRFEKVSKDTSIEHSTNGWPIIYEVHILYIVHVLSLMAQVNVKNSVVLHSLKFIPFTRTIFVVR